MKKAHKQTLKALFWALLIGGASAFLLSCSPAKKLEICQDWAVKHPEIFKVSRDTIYLTDTIPGDTIRTAFTFSQLSKKPVQINRPGLSLEIREAGGVIYTSAATPPRIDTLTIYKDIIQPPPPVEFWRAPFRWRWLQIGFFGGFILSLWVFSVLNKRA